MRAKWSTVIAEVATSREKVIFLPAIIMSTTRGGFAQAWCGEPAELVVLASMP